MAIKNWSRTIETPRGYKGEPAGRQSLLDKVYLGKVKDNRDVRSMGRLKVWFPELSQREDDPNGWVLVSYCSPFAGATSINSYENPSSGNDNTFNSTQKSYGWWAVPPDLNVQVICIFVNGDPAKGYWIGCVYDEQMNYMVPGIASDDGVAPKAEYNRKTPGLGRSETPKRPNYEPLYAGLLEQGLTTDTVRGISSSTAKRKGDHGTNNQERDKLTHKDKPAKVYGFTSPGGHQMVFDDNENSGFIRFRTKGGAQVLIDDTNGFVYFITKNGASWIELSDNNGIGNADVYSSMNVNLHAENGNINIKAGQNVNIQAGKNINLKSNTTTLHSTASIKLYSEGDIFNDASTINQNASTSIFLTGPGSVEVSSAAFIATSPIISFNKTPAGIATAGSGISGFSVPGPAIQKGNTWIYGSNYSAANNIIPRVPQHEPWSLHTINTPLSTSVTATTFTDLGSAESSTGRTATLMLIDLQTVENIETPELFVGDTPLGATVCNLTAEETKSLLDYLGRRESSSDYTAVNTLNYLGKYQFGTAALEDVGYIKKGTFATQSGSKQSALNTDANWTGRNGVKSKADFLANIDAQEDAIVKLMNKNCKSLKNRKVITSSSTHEEIAGYLAASHISGTAGAQKLKDTGVSLADAYGGSSGEYYELGVGSVKVLKETQNV